MEREIASINVEESKRILNDLNCTQPNTDEMATIFNEIKEKIDSLNKNDEAVIFNIDAMGGSGKSTFVKKIYHYGRSKMKIVLGSSSTSLSCQVYAPIFFDTTHGIASVPVMEDEEDYDNINNIFCDLNKNPEKAELFRASDILVFDESFSLHKYVINAILNSYDNLKGKIVIFVMDRGQTAAIVPKGSRRDIVNATILTHPIWKKFIQRTLTKNLRLLAFEENPEVAQQQLLYAKVLTQIRTNGPFPLHGPIVELDHDVVLGSKLLRYEGYKYFTQPEDVIDFLYPEGFYHTNLTNRAILCSTNERCDYWNSIIQGLNDSEQQHQLLAAHDFYDVDDPHGILKDMLNADTLEYYSKPGVPPNELNLKVNDICFLLRTLSKKDHLCKNVRVKILSISRYRIRVLTLGEVQTVKSIPRIRFKITHPVGFTLLRTQFPLQLAYAMTKNKSQGQSLPWCVNDITVESFSHGQEYVALSRPQEFQHVAIFCLESQTFDGAVCIRNVVYPELFENASVSNQTAPLNVIMRNNEDMIRYDSAFVEYEDYNFFE